MRVVHITMTPLAGSPIRIVKALNAHTEVTARLVNLKPNAYGTRTFPEDLLWSADHEEAIELIGKADILHFHHPFPVDEENNPFCFNFKSHAPKSCRFVRHHHSVRNTAYKRHHDESVDLFELVVPHSAERYFPQARVVPNIIPINDQDYQPVDFAQKATSISFSPSSNRSRWADRWETKGTPEVLRMLRRLRKKTGIELNIAQNMPHQECMALKQKSMLAIDDLVTGSYHLSALESLSQGVPVLCYTDDRAQDVLRDITGANRLPFINTHIDDAAGILENLIGERELIKELGNSSRAWMEKYFCPERLSAHYADAYIDILENKLYFTIKSVSPRPTTSVDIWKASRMSDVAWQRRQPLYHRYKNTPRKLLKRLEQSLRRKFKRLTRQLR